MLARCFDYYIATATPNSLNFKQTRAWIIRAWRIVYMSLDPTGKMSKETVTANFKTQIRHFLGGTDESNRESFSG
jgi:hypothetical protein